MSKLNSTNSFEVDVVDQYDDVMFVAHIDFNKHSAFQNYITPSVLNADRNQIDYFDFDKIMSLGY